MGNSDQASSLYFAETVSEADTVIEVSGISLSSKVWPDIPITLVHSATTQCPSLPSLPSDYSLCEECDEIERHNQEESRRRQNWVLQDPRHGPNLHGLQHLYTGGMRFYPFDEIEKKATPLMMLTTLISCILTVTGICIIIAYVFVMPDFVRPKNSLVVYDDSRPF